MVCFLAPVLAGILDPAADPEPGYFSLFYLMKYIYFSAVAAAFPLSSLLDAFCYSRCFC